MLLQSLYNLSVENDMFYSSTQNEHCYYIVESTKLEDLKDIDLILMIGTSIGLKWNGERNDMYGESSSINGRRAICSLRELNKTPGHI